MLSYQHAFHAGNHADVIKHLCWLGVINHLNKKAKPYTLIDTHAGNGIYPLDSEQALKTHEYKSGIDVVRQQQAAGGLLGDYQKLCERYLSLNQYPGSPAVSVSAARAGDHLHLMELHPAAFQDLSARISGIGCEPQLHLHHRDGLEGGIALCPPTPKRGAVLIDPPYERKAEYQEVQAAVEKMLKRWRSAQLVVWYPLLSERAGEKCGASERMIRKLGQSGNTAFCAELIVLDRSQDPGMYGSGVCVINPAWQLDTELEQALKEVTRWMGPSSSYRINWLKTEQS
ncbi:23S rRNA (adenine(2030)-N(6))-methyltransferase RlmJ [Alteromonas aestuariivivens]|uniref:Ribosomal RNA large subunit methyltransferase J n=1 Tax=Alteromonas aestuariivivens TaxID=1938339 RepID=A0A3D8M8J1_9ALTE|nr:23S rRNA (adenine(2030)-N(6))-methyltransferase RlmJ [Alteromonas aestuariivivens]RDV25983.1 23S rRNA (adenine(2030)-N(6))-methyltransferase RlmJ [Alteromonas aestuariivivens]